MTRREGGMAAVEALLIGIVLLVPMVWLLGMLADVHRSALALSAAAREAGTDAALGADLQEASAAIDAAVSAALRDHGVDPTEAKIRWSTPGKLERGAAVDVEVSVKVPVLQAPLLGRLGGPGVWVTARHSARVDPFGSAP